MNEGRHHEPNFQSLARSFAATYGSNAAKAGPREAIFEARHCRPRKNHGAASRRDIERKILVQQAADTSLACSLISGGDVGRHQISIGPDCTGIQRQSAFHPMYRKAALALEVCDA